MRHLVIVLAAFLAFGCSSPDSDENHSASKGDPETQKLWEWQGDGAAPDLAVDDAECHSQTDPDAAPLAQVGQYGACMLKKGWKMKETGAK